MIARGIMTKRRFAGIAGFIALAALTAPCVRADDDEEQVFNIYYYAGRMGHVYESDPSGYKQTHRLTEYELVQSNVSETVLAQGEGFSFKWPDPLGDAPENKKWVGTVGIVAVPIDIDVSQEPFEVYLPADDKTPLIQACCLPWRYFKTDDVFPGVNWWEPHDEPIDEHLVLDDGDCGDSGSCSGGCDDTANGTIVENDSINIKMGLGTVSREAVPDSMGRLRIYSPTLEPGLADRAALQYHDRYGVEGRTIAAVTRDAGGSLESIVSDESIALVSNVTDGFKVEVYTNEILPSNLLRTTTITSNGTSLVVAFDSNDHGVWTKEYAPATEEGHPALALIEKGADGTVLRRWITGSWSNATEYTKFTIHRSGGPAPGDVVSRKVTTYNRYTNQVGYVRWRKVRREVGVGDEARVSNWEYDIYGREVLSIGPNGNWTHTEYESTNRYARVSRRTRPWGNAPHTARHDPLQCSMTEYAMTQSSYLVTNFNTKGQEVVTEDRRTHKTETESVTGVVTRVTESIEIYDKTRGEMRSRTNILETGSGQLVTVFDHESSGKPTTYPDGTVRIVNTWSDKADSGECSGGPFGARQLVRRTTFTGSADEQNGRRTVTWTDTALRVEARSETWLIVDGNELMTSMREVLAVDDNWRPTRVQTLSGIEETVYGCCGTEQTVNAEGIVTDYGYDELKRRITTTKAGVVTSNTYDEVGRRLATYRYPEGGTPILVSSNRYNSAGELVASVDALGYRTSYSNWVDDVQGWVYRQTTYPDGSVTLNQSYRDGRIYQTTGTAVNGARHSYRTLADGTQVHRTTKLLSDNSPSDEWSETYTDMGGRTVKTMRSDGVTVSESFYDAQGRIRKTVDADGVATLYAYNSAGEQRTVAIDMDRDDVIDYDGTDRITESVTEIATNGVQPVTRSYTRRWNVDGVDGSIVSGYSDTAPDGMTHWQVAGSAKNRQIASIDRFRAERVSTNIAAAGNRTVSTYTNGLLMSVMSQDSAGTPVTWTTYSYDGLNRRVRSIDSRGVVTAWGYDIAGRLVAVTNALGAAEQQVTTYRYDSRGRRYETVLPDGGVQYTAYLPTGQVATNWGTRTYPVAYTYDYAGRMQTMSTWTNFSSDLGAAVTTWRYHSHNGSLTNKVYDDGNGPTYTYTDAGRLLTRTWARGITTTYGYDNAGSLETVSYSDTTPSITYTYNRLGQQQSVVSGAGTVTYGYTALGQNTNEAWQAGPLAGTQIHRRYDDRNRHESLKLSSGTTPLIAVTYGYDEASRLASVAGHGGHTASYGYTAGSHRIGSITQRIDNVIRMTTVKTYDPLNRLESINAQPVGGEVFGYSYQYNSANQRVRADLSNGTYWDYEYDDLGQVTNAVRRWVLDDTPVAGLDFGFQFDDIGNRRRTTRGDATSDYTANSLNQYDERTVPGSIDITGTAAINAIVTVNKERTTRKGEYFHRRLVVDNSAAAVKKDVSVIAVRRKIGPDGKDLVEEKTGKKYVAKSPEQFAYDLDGNLTSDGRYTYTWNGENRLIKVEPTNPSAGDGKVGFTYDHQGRRTTKTVSYFDGTVWSLPETTAFVYDGWNLIAEIPAAGQNTYYTWGPDLSGSMQGAGGIGGLLAVTTDSGTYLPAFDGNGNICQYIDGSDGSVAAEREYSPFGQTVAPIGVSP